MYRKLASAVLVASAISTQYAVAVNLGEMTMLSALNEPLKAEIRLRNAGDLDASQIRISFASADEFAEAGFERTFFHGNVEFDVELDGSGNGVIKLNSERRLNEPFIDLLIEARWPTGRMLRSYTALVDLPVYEDAPAEPVDTGRPAVDKTVEARPPAPARTTAEPPQPVADKPAPEEPATEKPATEKPATKEPRPAPRTAYAESGDYLTQRNDTLWGISRDLTREQDVSINQAMIALQEMNPEAFTGGNINRLQAGVVMRMPTPQAMREISASQANARVAEQNRRWKDAQLGGDRIAAEPSGPAPVERDGHLSLTSAGTGLADGEAEEAVGQLQQELHAKSESLEVANLEKQELGERVDALQSQVEQLQRLIQLKDTELAALQSELGRTDEISDEEVQQLEAELAEIQAVEDAAREELAEEQAADLEAEPAEEKPEVAEAEPAPEPEQPVFVPEEDEPMLQPGLLDRVLANPIYIGGIGLLIIAGVAGFLLRRKSLAERQVLEDNDSFDFDMQADAEDVAEEGDLYSGGEAADDLDALDDAESDAETGADTFAEAEQYDTEPEEQTTTVQTGDAIGEAEIYIAYNQYGQAIELLKNAIRSAPQDTALKSKLIEVCVASGNKEVFQNTFLDLQASGDEQAIAEAKELLSTNEEAADWLDDLPQAEAGFTAGSNALLDDDEGLGLDDELNLDADDGLGELEDSFMTHDGQSLEEDLSLDMDDDSAASEAEDDGSFDLSAELESDLSDDLGDLDLGDSDDELQLDGLGDELDTDSDQTLTAGNEEELSLDMGDLPDDAAAEPQTDESDELTLDSPSVDDDQEDELSLDLSSFDETQLEESSADESAAPGEDILEFDGLDLESPADDSDEPKLDTAPADDELSLELPEESTESATTGDDAALDDISLDDLDFGETDEQSVDAGQASAETEDEEGETLSLADFDLDFDDLDQEPGADAGSEQAEQDDQTILRDAVSLDTAEEPQVPEKKAPQTQIEPYDEDHVSSPLESLEEDDLTFLSDADEVSTKLDLAQAYIDMGDVDGAREILLEVVKEGGEEQKTEAAALLDSLE